MLIGIINKKWQSQGGEGDEVMVDVHFGGIELNVEENPNGN